jgi:hypothetical protein
MRAAGLIMVNADLADIFNRLFETWKSGKEHQKSRKNAVKNARGSGVNLAGINHDTVLRKSHDLLIL